MRPSALFCYSYTERKWNCFYVRENLITSELPDIPDLQAGVKNEKGKHDIRTRLSLGWRGFQFLFKVFLSVFSDG
jgi:hypothetical protein